MADEPLVGVIDASLVPNLLEDWAGGIPVSTGFAFVPSSGVTPRFSHASDCCELIGQLSPVQNVYMVKIDALLATPVQPDQLSPALTAALKETTVGPLE